MVVFSTRKNLKIKNQIRNIKKKTTKYNMKIKPNLFSIGNLEA